MGADTLRSLPRFPECTIIAFPTERRVGKIRRTADVLNRRHGRGAEFYWHQVVDGMVSQMERAGLDRAVIDHEIRAFHDAVQRALQAAGQERPDGGNAA